MKFRTISALATASMLAFSLSACSKPAEKSAAAVDVAPPSDAAAPAGSMMATPPADSMAATPPVSDSMAATPPAGGSMMATPPAHETPPNGGAAPPK